MGLRNLSIPEVNVELPGGGTFAVRGLSPDMCVGIYGRHAGELSGLFDRYAATGSLGDTATIVGELMTSAPVIMAELIALASGSKPSDVHVEDPGDGRTDWQRDVDMARSLPLPVQVDALTKIAEATFTSAMPLGKFLAVVIKAAGSTTAALSPKD